ncbi:hypothetical protein B9Z55_003301 [Caenorhabditis nigoni]|nr:hypothetical protein B9Z55_003301 [Caenorhabditis nigoni]
MPYVVQNMIIAELDLDERMLLSFTSKRTCRLLGMSKLYTNPYLSIKVRSDGVEVRIDNEDKWTFSIPYDKSALENVVYWKIDGSDVRVSHEVKEVGTEIKKHTVSIVEGADFKRTRISLDPLGKLLRHLSSFLNYDILHCICHTLPNGFISQLDCSLNYAKVWIRHEHVTIREFGRFYGRFRTREFKEDRAAVVTPKELEVLFSKIKIRELKLHVKFASAVYKYRKHPEPIGGPLIQKLILENHTWVDFSQLPTARIISFSRQVQSHEINTMFKSWVAGKNREIEIMYFEIGNKVTDRTRNFLFTGIAQHETQLTKAEIDSFLCYWFETNAWRPYQQRLRNIISLDIIREGDGLRATVIVATAGSLPDPEQKVFVMVWSEENLRTIGRAID